jgi:hypothetical protein
MATTEKNHTVRYTYRGLRVQLLMLQMQNSISLTFSTKGSINLLLNRQRFITWSPELSEIFNIVPELSEIDNMVP